MRTKSSPDTSAAGDLAPTRALARPGAGELAPGTLVAGKYAIEHLVGSGAMGKVYAARHVELGISVAIKIVAIDGRDTEASVRRFLREARVAAGIKSLHTVAVHDAGELPTGEPYLVMDLLRGMDLWQYALERGGLPVDEAIEYVRQAATVLELAHQKGIVHRDLKPTNLFRVSLPGGAGRVKVLDFGLAKRLDPDDASIGPALTMRGDVLGSPAFMSPEQIVGADTVDARADVWSLSATLYAILTQARPFSGSSLVELFMNVLESSPRDVRELRPDVPPHVARAIARGMERDLDRRFASVRDLVSALLTPVVPAPAVPMGTPPSTASAVPIERQLSAPAPTPRGAGAAKGIALAAALAIVLAGMLAAWKLTTRDAAPTRDAVRGP